MGFLSLESKVAAAEIEQRLQLGSKLSDVINTVEDAVALFNLFVDEGYILTEHLGRFCVSNVGYSNAMFVVSCLYSFSQSYLEFAP